MSDLFILGSGKPPPDPLGLPFIEEIDGLKVGDRITRFNQPGTVWFLRIFDDVAWAFIAQDDGLMGVTKVDEWKKQKQSSC